MTLSAALNTAKPSLSTHALAPSATKSLSEQEKPGITFLSIADPDPNAWQLVLRRIDSFAAIDNDEGDAPSAAVVSSAKDLAKVLSGSSITPTNVYATPAGSIVFEWRTEPGFHFEIELPEPSVGECMLMEAGKPTRHWQL